jgi:hypothetical protein
MLHGRNYHGNESPECTDVSGPADVLFFDYFNELSSVPRARLRGAIAMSHGQAAVE